MRLEYELYELCSFTTPHTHHHSREDLPLMNVSSRSRPRIYKTTQSSCMLKLILGPECWRYAPVANTMSTLITPIEVPMT